MQTRCKLDIIRHEGYLPQQQHDEAQKEDANDDGNDDDDDDDPQRQADRPLYLNVRNHRCLRLCKEIEHL